MKFVSTKGNSGSLNFSAALAFGLAPDGGLFVPDIFPSVDLNHFSSADSLPDLGAKLLHPFLSGDPLQAELPDICRNAFNFPVPLRYRADRTAVLELFHGPTAAFKDIGARFLAECISRIPSPAKRTVLVATSGDTGGAVASAFFGKKDIDVYVLFPKGKISLRQEKQIAGFGENVKAFAVRGDFDDCQKLVKEALSDSKWRQRKNFISANSISVGRLLPQMTYYAKASLDFQAARKRSPGFIIPTGNLGNAVAALWAKRAGLPIGKIILATNANRSISDFFSSGQWKPNSTIATLANAMDVGDPSNMERLRALYPDFQKLKDDVATTSVTDAEITNEIRSCFDSGDEIFCPHTATALVARKNLPGCDWILVSTAHAAKFETIVEPLIAKKIEVPPALAELLGKASVVCEIDPTLDALKENAERITPQS